MKNVLIILAFLLISPIMIRGIVATLADNPDATPYEVTTQTESNNYRDSFVTGCQSAEGTSEQMCQCIYDKISSTYGEKYIIDNASRWANDGLTDAEFELIKPCA